MSRPRTTRAITNLIRKGVVKKKRRGLKQSNLYTLYDNPAIWAAESEEEMCDMAKSSFPYTSEEMIEELKRRGAIEIIETKKEPVPVTDQSSDTSVSYVKYNPYSCNNSNRQKSESQDLYTVDDLRDLYAYDWMVEQVPLDRELIDYIIQIIHRVVNSEEPTVRIRKTVLNRETVRAQLLGLTEEEILYVIQKYKEQTGKVENPEAYLLSMLYTAKGQMRADIENQMRNDFS
jgi:hypothetical protein